MGERDEIQDMFDMQLKGIFETIDKQLRKIEDTEVVREPAGLVLVHLN